MPAKLLLEIDESAGGEIHAADLAKLLKRYGVELIVDHIETEAQVVDILDYDVKYGQGFLFSPPRPVRAEVLGSKSDRDVQPAAATG